MLLLLHLSFRVACVAGTFQQQILCAAVAHRRRVAVTALNHFAAGHSSGQGPQGPKVRFDTEFSWHDHVARLSDRDFSHFLEASWYLHNATEVHFALASGIQIFHELHGSLVTIGRRIRHELCKN